MNKMHSINSCLIKSGQLFSFLLIMALCYVPMMTYAHPSPNSIVLLDVNANRVEMELQLPVPELELAFGHGTINDPETLIERMELQLRNYLMAHIHAYVKESNPWQVEIKSLRMDKGIYVGTSNVYWEVIVQILLEPQQGESTRAFTLDYDVITHQVMNHTALVSIRNDWEAGVNGEHPVEVGVIRADIETSKTIPLFINQNGSKWNGFKNMVALGMEHIKEGTDHLLFLLVLLLAAPLVAGRKKWIRFGGVRYSLLNVLKIVTAFTIGHSLTLLLGVLNWVHLPSQPIEVLIAFSILISAAHALRPMFPGREVFVAIGFGLIHGLAFADTLTNLHLDGAQMALSILGFNLGIEIMQLAVVIMIMPWLIILCQSKVYDFIRITGSLISAVAAIAWIAERIEGQPNSVTVLMEQLFQFAPWGIALLAAMAIVVLIISKLRKQISLSTLDFKR